jgi:hypothetical protein
VASLLQVSLFALTILLAMAPQALAGNGPRWRAHPSSTEREATSGEGAGLYAVWAGARRELLDLPYVQGGQIVVQWADMESAQGVFDFTALDAQLRWMAASGHRATLQVNGNRKPAYLFQIVPHHPGQLGPQINDPMGTLMYWHPNHIQAYQALLKALSDHLQASPHAQAILGLRLNDNALGTEQLIVPARMRPLEQWVVPPGISQGPPWSERQAIAYRNTIVSTHLALFPGMRLFLRTDTDLALIESHHGAREGDSIGWFHTASEMEPRGDQVALSYQRLDDECRKGAACVMRNPGLTPRATTAASATPVGAARPNGTTGGCWPISTWVSPSWASMAMTWRRRPEAIRNTPGPSPSPPAMPAGRPNPPRLQAPGSPFATAPAMP